MTVHSFLLSVELLKNRVQGTNTPHLSSSIIAFDLDVMKLLEITTIEIEWLISSQLIEIKKLVFY